MNVAVFGANGFLGRNLIVELLKNNHTVWAFYRNEHDRIPGGCTKINIEKLSDVTTGFDCIYISIGNYALTQDQFVAQHLFIATILKTIRFKRVIYVSSVAVYGNHKEPIGLHSSFNNPSDYGLSKLSDEFLIRGAASFSIVRFTYLYGSGMSSNSMIPKLYSEAKIKKTISIFGDGSRCQDYLHVSDAVAILIRLISKKDNSVLIGASGKSLSNKLVAMEISKNIPGAQIIIQGEETASSFFYDVENTKTYLDWKPGMTFESGIKKIIDNDLAGI